MKNNVKSFALFIKRDKDNNALLDKKSSEVSNRIREINSNSPAPLQEKIDSERSEADLIIAVGGDGTFIDSVTSTGFDKSKIYAGVHTGTLGFLQNLSPEDMYSTIATLNEKQTIPTRKLLVSSVTVSLIDGKILQYYSLNDVLIDNGGRSKISFAEYIEDELLQNISGDGIIIATKTGDTAHSMNTGGAIDFSGHFQLVRTLKSPIMNASYERFISNTIICPMISIVLEPSSNINITIDGIHKDIDSNLIKSVSVSMLDGSNYIHKYELGPYSKVNIVRTKILGYKN